MSVLVCVVACGNSQQNGEGSATVQDADPRPTIALILKSLANEFFVTMANGAKAHQASALISII